MANNVTKAYIKATCDSQLIQYARDVAANCSGVTSGNSSTDEVLARAEGIPIQSSIDGSSGSYWSVSPSGSSLTLYNSDIDGPEIEASVKRLMNVLSRVRRVYFVKTKTENFSGNAGRSYSGTWVNPYFRYGYANTTALDSGHYRPSNYEAYFNGLTRGQNITQATWDAILAGMRSILASNFELLTYTVSYCHYSCHSSCHYSRGRR